MPRKHSITPTGERFGKLVVIYATKKGCYLAWGCQCDCGQTAVALAANIRQGRTRSCGCFERESRIDHGHAGSLTYKSWINMIARVDSNSPLIFPYYKGRGITVCERWRKFENFLIDVGERPSSKYSLDRYPDNDGNYEPGNVRWALHSEQMRNTRRTKMITFNGLTMCERDWANHLSIPKSTLEKRLKRWSLERALTEPINKEFRSN